MGFCWYKIPEKPSCLLFILKLETKSEAALYAADEVLATQRCCHKKSPASIKNAPSIT
jgi:hypothetical protein